MYRLRITVTTLALGVATICVDPAAAENVLRWSSVGGALTADPHAYDEVPTNAQIRQVYESLVIFDSNLNLAPGLAREWRLVEPTTWEVELRPNVRFHDGTPLTARDVVFSFRRAKADIPAGYADYVESIADVRAIDERTVRFETSFPDPQLMDQLRNICIMSSHWAEQHAALVPANVSAGEENYASRQANGIGPFILKESSRTGRLSWLAIPTGGVSSNTRITLIGSSTPR
jgi:peptide/nickel transport system substrate-binding protein